MDKNILIIAITKRKYANTQFADDRYFFNEGFNFCFIDDKSRHYKLYHTDENEKEDEEYLTCIKNSGILMIYDGDDAPGGYDMDLNNMFKVLGQALDERLKICLWYHTSTSGEIEEKVEQYFTANIHIIEVNESSHRGNHNEIFTYIPQYFDNEIELEEIIEKCYTEKSKERAFQYGLPALYEKLTALKMKNGKLAKDKAYANFIAHRDWLVNQQYN